jgi:hypothetical protein
MMIRFIFILMLGWQHWLQAQESSLRTSVSDLPYWREDCAKAASDQTIFDHFRKSSAMIYVVELRYENLGWEYIRYVSQHYPFLLNSPRRSSAILRRGT